MQKKFINTQMEAELADQAERFAVQHDMTTSAVVRQALREYLTKYGYLLPGPQDSQPVPVVYREIGE